MADIAATIGRFPQHRGRSHGLRALFVVFVVLTVLSHLPGVDPYRVDLDAVQLPPSFAHPLGTDENGRDALARVLTGAQMTIGVGGAGAAIAVLLGTALGAVAGYRGGLFDSVAMRFVDLALAFPALLLILFFSTVLPTGGLPLIALIGLTGWMPVARLVRGNVRELLTATFLEASRSMGATGGWMIRRHLLPNTVGVLFVAALAQLNRAILAEATISFLGLGIQPPTPTWGNLLIGAQDYVYTAPWLALAPGLAITVTLGLIYTLGVNPTAPAVLRTTRGSMKTFQDQSRLAATPVGSVGE